MNYKTMIEDARSKGLTNETAMWTSIDNLSEILEVMKAEHSDLYWKFMRKQYGILYSNHYGPDFAEYDVSQISYTDANGAHHTGRHWTKEEIEAATSGRRFPSGTTLCDKYVAYNAAYADFCKHFTEEQILDIAFDFYFADEDWKSNTKVWDYFCCRYK